MREIEDRQGVRVFNPDDEFESAQRIHELNEANDQAIENQRKEELEARFGHVENYDDYGGSGLDLAEDDGFFEGEGHAGGYTGGRPNIGFVQTWNLLHCINKTFGVGKTEIQRQDDDLKVYEPDVNAD